MKNLIYKEFKLLISPIFFAFCALTALLLVPAWPYSLAFLYSFFAIQTQIALAVTFKDAEFMSILPVTKSAFVHAKAFSVVFLQLLQLVVAIPFAIISSLVLNPSGNPLSIDANFTLFGVALIGFAVFNAIFLPGFFKTGCKAGVWLLLAVLANIFLVIVAEVLVGAIPILQQNLDSLTLSGMGWRLLVLLVGAVFYAVITLFSIKKSQKNYEKVNL